MCAQAQDVRRNPGSNSTWADAWKRRHAVYYREKQPSIGSLKPPTICEQVGMCVCAESSKGSWLLSENLKRLLPKLFTKKKKVASPERQLLEEHQIVFRFVTADVRDDGCVEDVWLHPAYINFSLWRFAAMRLLPVPASDVTAATPSDCRPLHVDPTDMTASTVQNSVEHFKSAPRLEHAWSLEFWRISEPLAPRGVV